MSETENSDSSLAVFRTDLEQEDVRALQRVKVAIAVKVVLVVFVAGYMSWIMSVVSRLDARELTRIAAMSVEERVPQWRAEVRDYALAVAPDVTDQARDMFVTLPGHMREYLETELLLATDTVVRRFESDVASAVGTVLDDQIETMKAEMPDSSPEEQLEFMVMGVSGLFRDTMTEALDVFYVDYAAEVKKLNAHLDHLLRGDNLTESEKIDKQLIEAWIILVNEHDFIDPSGVLERLDI